MKKMMKTTIATGAILMLSALATQALAQGSNVTIYGYIDIGVIKDNDNSTKLGKGQNNWLGVLGREEINNDLAAIFNVQMRFEPDTGVQEKSTTLFQGATTVGLSSKMLGTLELGRKLTPLWNQKWVYDPWYDSALMGSLADYNGDINSDGRIFPKGGIVKPNGTVEVNDFHDFSRISNGVYYSTPTFSGVTLHTAIGTELPIGANTKARSVSLNYQNGPLNAMLAYEKNLVSDSITYVAGSYVLGQWSVMGSYAHTNFDTVSATKQGFDSSNSKHIALIYKIGANSIRTGYGRIKELDKHKAVIGYNHALSKRTNVYADLYRETKIRVGVNANAANGVALGMNHTF
jgi:predicted porin